ETVESVTVLKDASASAVYGSRAPFGVILITTKRGKANQETAIKYTNNLSLASPIKLPHFIDSYTWPTAYNQANANAGLNQVRSETVESVTVLKDASASAVYGSRAPFGVILITTKRGKANQETAIKYTNNLSLASPIKLPHFIDSYTWATAYNQANANAGLNPVYSDEQMERIKGYIDGTFPHEYDPENPINNIWAGRRNGNANNDWPHILMGNNSLSHKHNLN